MRAGLAFFAHAARLPAHGGGNAGGFVGAPEALGALFGVLRVFFPVGVKPAALVAARLRQKSGVHFPVVARHVLADLLLAIDHDGQRGRLHAAHGGEEKAAALRVEGRHGARAVDAHQPVGLAAAAGGIGQALHLRVAAQAAKALAYGLRRHALQPQPLHGLGRVLAVKRILRNQAEDEFALAPRVAGVHQAAHVLAARLFHHGGQARFGLFHGLEVKVRRNHRQVREAPFAALDIKCFRRLDFQQVAHGARDHVLLVFKMVFVLVEAARHGRKRPHDVLRHRGLFSNDQGFHAFTIRCFACARPRAHMSSR